MGTSTKRPKPKPGQSAGKNVNGKPSANQQTAAAQSAAKATADAAEGTSEAKTSATPGAKATSGDLSSTAKTTTAKAPTSPTSAKVVAKGTPAPARPQPTRPLSKQGQKRAVRREEFSRKIEERRQQREREQRNRRLKKWAIVVGIPALAIIALGVLIYNLVFGLPTPLYQQGVPIDGVQCNANEQLVSHYHAHLQIYVNGQQVSIPTDVGRQAPGCFYWLHTHPIPGDAGVIHIESPDSRTYNVKEFFDIWGQQISTTSLMGHKVDASHKLTAYVYYPTAQPPDTNTPFTVTPPSNLVPYTGDITKIILKPHALVVLEYGTPVVPPQAFTFIAGE